MSSVNTGKKSWFVTICDLGMSFTLMSYNTCNVIQILALYIYFFLPVIHQRFACLRTSLPKAKSKYRPKSSIYSSIGDFLIHSVGELWQLQLPNQPVNLHSLGLISCKFIFECAMVRGWNTHW